MFALMKHASKRTIACTGCSASLLLLASGLLLGLFDQAQRHLLLSVLSPLPLALRLSATLVATAFAGAVACALLGRRLERLFPVLVATTFTGAVLLIVQCAARGALIPSCTLAACTLGLLTAFLLAERAEALPERDCAPARQRRSGVR